MLKVILCSAAFLAASQAQASWFQSYCTSADGTLTQASGHNELYFHATQRTWDTSGRVDVKLPLEGVQTVASDVTTLIQETTDSCKPGDQYGVASWHNVTFSRVRITNDDGSLFPENVVGATSDRTAIETTWLCEHKGNSLGPCNQP